MNSEYILSMDDIKRINEQNGGSIRNDAVIETALSLGKGKTISVKIAFLWNAIIVGHPFTDGNKRTAYLVAIQMLDKSGIKIDRKQKNLLVKQIVKIASKNISDSRNIERMVRYAIEGN